MSLCATAVVDAVYASRRDGTVRSDRRVGRCAGSEFDATVVDAFAATLAADRADHGSPVVSPR